MQAAGYVAREKTASVGCHAGPTLQGNPAAECPHSTAKIMCQNARSRQTRARTFFCQTAGEPPSMSPSSQRERVSERGTGSC